MKNYLIIFLVIGLLISNSYFISQKSKYEEPLKDVHYQAVIHIGLGIDNSKKAFAELVTDIKGDYETVEHIVRMRNVLTYLEVTKLSAFNLSPYLRLSASEGHFSIREIDDFFRSIQRFMEFEYTDFLLGDDTFTQDEIVYHLETFHQGLQYLSKYLDLGLINQGDYETVKNHWHELMEEIITFYPENTAFQQYFERNYTDEL